MINICWPTFTLLFIAESLDLIKSFYGSQCQQKLWISAFIVSIELSNVKVCNTFFSKDNKKGKLSVSNAANCVRNLRDFWWGVVQKLRGQDKVGWW